MYVFLNIIWNVIPTVFCLISIPANFARLSFHQTQQSTAGLLACAAMNYCSKWWESSLIAVWTDVDVKQSNLCLERRGIQQFPQRCIATSNPTVWRALRYPNGLAYATCMLSFPLNDNIALTGYQGHAISMGYKKKDDGIRFSHYCSFRCCRLSVSVPFALLITLWHSNCHCIAIITFFHIFSNARSLIYSAWISIEKYWTAHVPHSIPRTIFCKDS